MKKIFHAVKKLIFFSVLLCSVSLFAGTYGSQQLLPAGHWVYDALFMLNNETKRTSFATNAPLSVGELKMYLTLIPYAKLSDSGKNLYDRLDGYLSEKSFTFDMGPVYFGFNVELYPELLYKSNSGVDWTFSTDYTGHKNSVSGYNILSPSEYRSKTLVDDVNSDWSHIGVSERPMIKSGGEDYGAASGFLGSSASTSFITLPLYLGWSDYFIIQTDPVFAKSFWGMSENYNFVNLVYNSDDMDFLWPRNAYGSAGKTFEKWGVNLNFGRQGLQIGKTQTGSVIYNSTFETEGYFQLNLYSPRLKYNLDVVQVSTDKYLYCHNIEARPLFDWIRLGCLESTLVQSNFELKHLNPLMIMHSFGSWADTDYFSEDEEKYYGEAHICQYMGIQVELTPIKYTRIYFLYAQNEIQPPNEQGSINGKSMPDSFGGQLGFEVTVPDRRNGWWTGTLEGVYTTPFCYIKQGADWSLYSSRTDMQSNGGSPICSWIGTPFGPDAIGIQARAAYEQPGKWNCELDYLFVAHGTNSFGIFDNTIEINGVEYYSYYPSVLRKMGLVTDQEAEDIARSYELTGTVQYTNQITAKGKYIFNNHLNLSAQATYSFIFNNKNEGGEFAQAFEGILALEYTLFK